MNNSVEKQSKISKTIRHIQNLLNHIAKIYMLDIID